MFFTQKHKNDFLKQKCKYLLSKIGNSREFFESENNMHIFYAFINILMLFTPDNLLNLFMMNRENWDDTFLPYVCAYYFIITYKPLCDKDMFMMFKSFSRRN